MKRKVRHKGCGGSTEMPGNSKKKWYIQGVKEFEDTEKLIM